MALMVKKFGGSSVANAERVFNVANIIIEDYKKGNDVVVDCQLSEQYLLKDVLRFHLICLHNLSNHLKIC